VIIEDVVRYGMEFSLEEPHASTCPQHTIAHQSPNGGNSQPGDSWGICSITGTRKVDGVVEYCVDWEPTWMLEFNLGGAREFVDEYKARLSVLYGNKKLARRD
jgi:hypothetical protein